MRLVSIQIGAIRQLPADQLGATWETAFIKAPVDGRLRVGARGLAGDAQADRENHGGPEKALLAYSAAHYPRWRDEIGLDSAGGGFGENLTVDGADERTVCVGDVWRIGAVRVQVAQPRLPCSSISRRWGQKELLKQVKESGRTGWYLRVLDEGEIEAGLAIELVERSAPEWTVHRINSLFFAQPLGREDREALVACPALSIEYRTLVEKRAG
jgi:MOSC domain-containing protein YiiM